MSRVKTRTEIQRRLLADVSNAGTALRDAAVTLNTVLGFAIRHGCTVRDLAEILDLPPATFHRRANEPPSVWVNVGEVQLRRAQAIPHFGDLP
ncbi:MAG: hypothetical protein LC722_04855 [Actinobacteria bacterium]|nr:hypothetical protein [Actinomycetota bacterium]